VRINPERAHAIAKQLQSVYARGKLTGKNLKAFRQGARKSLQYFILIKPLDRPLQALFQLYGRFPFKQPFRFRYVRLALAGVILRQGLENNLASGSGEFYQNPG
jgi:hypothetical protein